MIQYFFREGPLPIKNKKRANPQKLGEAYEKAGRNDKRLHDAAANNPKHPWFKHLEWDNDVCGLKYRLAQISDIARMLAVKREDTEELRPAFISVVSDRGRRARYTPEEIHNSVDLREATLKAADRDLEAFQDRYKVLADICEDIGAVRKKIAARRPAESRVAA